MVEKTRKKTCFPVDHLWSSDEVLSADLVVDEGVTAEAGQAITRTFQVKQHDSNMKQLGGSSRWQVGVRNEHGDFKGKNRVWQANK